MPILLDKKPLPLPAHLSPNSTLSDALKWARTAVAEGRVLVRIHLNDRLLEGTSFDHPDPLGDHTLSLISADRKELSLTTLGKLAALIEWLTPQHKDVAALFERGDTQKALDRLGEILSAWQQIQIAYGNLAKMLDISLTELPVHELHGEAVLNEFCRQLSEIQAALQGRDFVLLADILQYEMDGAVANWMALLEATLGIVEPVTT
jgi:hypothetical protein